MILEELLNIISSSVGSLTNPTKLSNTFRSVRQMVVNPYTIRKYLDYFVDAFRSTDMILKGRNIWKRPLNIILRM